MVNFGEVLTRAWNIIWKNKILWLFGLFATLGAGGGNGGGSSGNFNFNFRNDQIPRPNGNVPLWLQQIMQRVQDTLGIWVVILLIVILLLIIIAIVLNTFGRIGLARGAWHADEEAGSARLSFGQLWQAGRQYFWRVLLLVLIMWALSIALALIIIIPTVGLTVLTLGIGLICLLPLLCVLAIVLWAITILVDLAVIAIVNENLGVIDSITRAWSIITHRPSDLAIMALILWIGSLVVGFIIGLPILLIFAPLIGSAFLGTTGALRGGIIISVVLFIIYLPVYLFARSIIQSYVSTAWTLVFRRVTGRMPGISSPQMIDTSIA
jgi:hypothetical protein